MAGCSDALVQLLIVVHANALGPSFNTCSLLSQLCGRLRCACIESSGSLPLFLGLGIREEFIPSMGISTLSGALAAGICDFDTPLILVKAPGKLFANCCRLIIL